MEKSFDELGLKLTEVGIAAATGGTATAPAMQQPWPCTALSGPNFKLKRSTTEAQVSIAI